MCWQTAAANCLANCCQAQPSSPSWCPVERPTEGCHPFPPSSPRQEFSFPDSLRLWDSLLADSAGRTDCLLRLCVAMLLNVREELMAVSE